MVRSCPKLLRMLIFLLWLAYLLYGFIEPFRLAERIERNVFIHLFVSLSRPFFVGTVQVVQIAVD